MVKSEAGSAGRTFVVSLLALAVLGLVGAVLYLLSDINHRHYRLAEHEGTLVVERGRLFPFGYKVFEPDAPDLKAGYAPISMPPGESLGKSEVHEDRADIDRALFALLASWARDRFDSKEPGDFELGASYVRRCELLPVCPRSNESRCARCGQTSLFVAAAASSAMLSGNCKRHCLTSTPPKRWVHPGHKTSTNGLPMWSAVSVTTTSPTDLN